MSTLPPDRSDGGFGPYLRAVRHHPWLVLLIALVTVAASIAWLSVRSVKYEATAQVLVTPVSDTTVTGLPILTDSVDPTRTVQTASTILSTPRTAVLAAAELGPDWPPARLLSAVKVEGKGNSNVVAITATAPEAPQAAAAANAYARAALKARTATLRSQADLQLASLQAQRKALGTSDPATSAALAGEISSLQAIRDGQDPNFSLLQAADVPDSSTATSSVLIVVLAVLIGLALGVAAALAIEQLDRRLRDEDQLMSVYPLPILSRVPWLGRRSTALPSPPEVHEAFRTLQVQLESQGRGGRVVMFTSATENDGKTTAAIDFAESLAASGSKVVLLDLDMRKPDVGARLGVGSDLRDLFRSDADLSQVLVASPMGPSVRVLSTTTVNGDIGLLLEALTRRLPELLTQARQSADFVIVDTAPLGHVSDALRIAALADDVLIVARPGNTNRTDLAQTRELLERIGVTPTGMLVIGGTGGAHSRYYGYGPLPAGRGVQDLAPSEVASLRRVGAARRSAHEEFDALP